MTLIISIIFLTVCALLAMNGMQNNGLNQTMSAASQAQIVALNTAEAGLVAGEAEINGQKIDLSHWQGQVDFQISSPTVDACQQQIFTILSTAHFQRAQIKLISQYLRARDPPLPDCVLNQTSRRLWWQQSDADTA